MTYTKPREGNNVAQYDDAMAIESAHNFAILDDRLKQDFVNAVNKLLNKNYTLEPPLDVHVEQPYGSGLSFPSEHPFYRDIYTYLTNNNPALLRESSVDRDDGVTYSQVAFYMIDRAQKEGLRNETKTSLINTETTQNLSGLKKLIIKEIGNVKTREKVLKEVDDVEAMKNSMTDNPASFNNTRKKEIGEVLDILPPDVDSAFVERMLNYLLLGALMQQGVIPYIRSDGHTRLDFTPQCGAPLKTAWNSVSGNADAFIPPDTLQGFMAYTASDRAPNETVKNLLAQLPTNAPSTRANILQVANISNSQKSLAISYIENDNSMPIDDTISENATEDAVKFKQANIHDTMEMVGNQTSKFADMAKKGKLPTSYKDMADLIRNPVSETGKRFGASGSLLMLIGLGFAAWKIGGKVVGKEAGWFTKTLGFIGVLAAFNVGGGIAGNFMENIPLEKIDPGKNEKEKQKLEAQFSKCVRAFHQDIFPGFFVLSNHFGKDTNNRPFGERVKAEKLFNNPTSFSLHPNIVDQTPELKIDGVVASPQALKAYKDIYRKVYFRRQDIEAARLKVVAAPALPDAVFPETKLNPAPDESLQNFLAKFYSASPNSVEIPEQEGFDMSKDRMKNFGLAPSLDQTTKKGEIKDKFKVLTSTDLVRLPNPHTGITQYDKKPVNIDVGLPPNTDTLQLPLWDPAELGYTAPNTPTYEQCKDGDNYLVKITDTSTTPPQECLCVLTQSKPNSKIYTVSAMLIDGVAYSRP